MIPPCFWKSNNRYSDKTRSSSFIPGIPQGATIAAPCQDQDQLMIELVRSDCFRSAGVTVDVTPHHLILDETAVLEHESMAKMNPPLRSCESRSGLLALVKNGMVDAIASDHAPHAMIRKRKLLKDAAFGIVGLETLLPLTIEALHAESGMPLLQILSLLTKGPARILRIPEPVITAGGKADIVLFNPDIEYSLYETGIFSKSENTPFLHRKLKGRVEGVWMGRPGNKREISLVQRPLSEALPIWTVIGNLVPKLCTFERFCCWKPMPCATWEILPPLLKINWTLIVVTPLRSRTILQWGYLTVNETMSGK